ncbi:ankyrin repeat domain-containing protein, partial [Bacteriovoracaceae bacterium]|nr:ankyrin repeat domain-containing protein [Bacteriovoracaceae bacterium]
QEEIIAREYTVLDLFIAAENEDLDQLAVIVASGIDVNRFHNKKTAILHAASHGKYKAVEFLQDNGAFIHIPNFDFTENVFSYLFKNENTPVSYLRKLKAANLLIIAPLKLFNYAISNHQINKLELLLDMHDTNGELITDTLHEKLKMNLYVFAMIEDDLAMAKMFFTKGVKITLLTRQGLPLVSSALGFGKYDFANFFLKYNARVDKQGRDGKTALINAVINKDLQGVNLLIDHDADKKIKDNSGKKACYYAKKIEKEFKDVRRKIKKELGCWPYIF